MLALLVLLALLAWLVHAVVSVPPLPSNTRTPFLLTFSSFLLLPIYFSTSYNDISIVALLQGGPGKY